MSLRRASIVLTAGALALGVASAVARPFPDVIALPNGFQPEGIAIGKKHAFYVGSIPTGAIYRGDLKTGRGAVLVPPASGRQAIGLAVDGLERVWVAGGQTGRAYVYDGRKGKQRAAYRLTTAGQTFVNDVVVTRGAAWFTDSSNPVLYRVPLAANLALPLQARVKAVELTGDLVYQSGFNANGIDATPDGKWLIVVQSNTGRLFRVDPRTGATDRIEISGGTLASGDGILLVANRLYVVQNSLNRVAVVELDAGLTAGKIVRRLRDSDLDVPTTIDRDGDRLYAVNARFGVADPGSARYAVVQIR